MRTRSVVTLAVAGLLLAAHPGSVSSQDAERGRHPRTVLRGTVADPATGALLPGTRVRLGNRTTTVRPDGSFQVRSGRRPRAYPTFFEQPGYEPYATWTPSRQETEQDVFLFPRQILEIPGMREPVTPENLLHHFDHVFRMEHYGGFVAGLTRWMEPPEIVVVDHVMRGIRTEAGEFWEVTDRPVSRKIISELRWNVGLHAPLLSGGFVPGVLRVKRVEPGQLIENTYENLAPEGAITFYVLDSERNSIGGSGRLRGHEIIGGLVYADEAAYARSRETYYRYGPRSLAHELGHALGWRHGQHVSTEATVPLCSIMGNNLCERDTAYFSNGHYTSPLDEIIARLAYSRRPGNDPQDRDPRPPHDSDNDDNLRVTDERFVEWCAAPPLPR